MCCTVHILYCTATSFIVCLIVYRLSDCVHDCRWPGATKVKTNAARNANNSDNGNQESTAARRLSRPFSGSGSAPPFYMVRCRPLDVETGTQIDFQIWIVKCRSTTESTCYTATGNKGAVHQTRTAKTTEQTERHVHLLRWAVLFPSQAFQWSC